MNLKIQTLPNLTYITYTAQTKPKKKTLVDGNKHKPQAKLPVFIWKNQNPNITWN
jgi:hypothetical protein